MGPNPSPALSRPRGPVKPQRLELCLLGDPHLQADAPAQPPPVPGPTQVPDALGWGQPQLPFSCPASGQSSGARTLPIFLMSTNDITDYFFNSIICITYCIKQTALLFRNLFSFMLFSERN